MKPAKSLGGALLGVGVIALAALASGRVAAGRFTRRVDPELDARNRRPLESELTRHLIPTADGGVLHVVEMGDPAGPPVILMHGITLQWWVWSAVMKALAPSARVFAWDMRGHGDSVAGSGGATLDGAASDLAVLLEHLDLTGAILVGHSMGGMTLGRFVVDHPEVRDERTIGLVFLATSAAAAALPLLEGGVTTLIGVTRHAAGAAARRPVLAPNWKRGDLSALLIRVAFGEHATAEMIEAVRLMEADMSIGSLAEAADAIADHDIRDGLGPLPQHVRVVVGDQDRLTPPAHARDLARRIPGAELVVLAGIGHQVMQEDPDAVVASVRAVGGI